MSKLLPSDVFSYMRDSFGGVSGGNDTSATYNSSFEESSEEEVDISVNVDEMDQSYFYEDNHLE